MWKLSIIIFKLPNVYINLFNSQLYSLKSIALRLCFAWIGVVKKKMVFQTNVTFGYVMIN